VRGLWPIISGTCNANGHDAPPVQVLALPHMECLDVIGHDTPTWFRTSITIPLDQLLQPASRNPERAVRHHGELAEAYWNGGRPTGWPVAVTPRVPIQEASRCAEHGDALHDETQRIRQTTGKLPRAECDGHLNALLVGKAGYLMGRRAAAGAAATGASP